MLSKLPNFHNWGSETYKLTAISFQGSYNYKIYQPILLNNYNLVFNTIYWTFASGSSQINVHDWYQQSVNCLSEHVIFSIDSYAVWRTSNER